MCGDCVVKWLKYLIVSSNITGSSLTSYQQREEKKKKKKKKKKRKEGREGTNRRNRGGKGREGRWEQGKEGKRRKAGAGEGREEIGSYLHNTQQKRQQLHQHKQYGVH